MLEKACRGNIGDPEAVQIRVQITQPTAASDARAQQQE